VIEIQTEDGDSPLFIAQVQAVVRGIAARHTPSELVLVKIDNWFGPRWLKFSGKLLGLFGVWWQELTVPPFVPNRVVWERRFRLPSCMEVKTSRPLHIATRLSSAEASRRVSDVEPGIPLIWFCGGSEINGRAAIMAYVPVADTYWTWYAGWSCNGSWKADALKGILAAELAALAEP
jgi:hypothetical protein